MNNNVDIKNIPAEKFVLVQQDSKIHDLKLETKPISYLKDALIRFKKSKSSVVAAWIIGLLIVFAIFVPIFSKYDVKYNDGFYSYTLPKNEFLAKYGIWNGYERSQLNQQTFDYMNSKPGAVVKVNKVYESAAAGGKGKTTTFYDCTVDTYMKTGYVYKQLTKDEYDDLVAYQQENNIQIMYPMVDVSQITGQGFKKDPNYWFKHTSKGAAIYDENGKYIDIYLRDEDTNELVYYVSKMNGNQYQVRVLYYEYYKYVHGFYPSFLFGTDCYGKDLLVNLASGARLSFILGICVATINLVIGTIYGAIEGYYGGLVDLIMERFVEILSGIPTLVTFALFQMYFARKVGVIVTLLFAFIFTGWINPAYRVRTQFYRFKGHEYVLAARTLGARDRRLIFKHILPNSLGTIITASILMIPSVIFTEAILSYLGIVDLQTSGFTSVGTILNNGQSALSTYPHALFFPSAYIALLMISFNLFGNGLRDAFNPSLRGAEE